MVEVEGYDLAGFGRRVLDRRKELGLSQVDLAKRAGVNESAVGRWEEGVLPRDADALARLAVALERSVGWVLGEQQSAAFLDGIRLALDHIRRVAEDDTQRLDTGREALLIEMRTGYAFLAEEARPVRRVEEAPPVPMRESEPPRKEKPQAKPKTKGDRGG